jgi:hypothetical protein
MTGSSDRYFATKLLDHLDLSPQRGRNLISPARERWVGGKTSESRMTARNVYPS